GCDAARGRASRRARHRSGAPARLGAARSAARRPRSRSTRHGAPRGRDRRRRAPPARRRQRARSGARGAHGRPARAPRRRPPPPGALQLELRQDAALDEHALARLSGFTARAAHALRTAGVTEETALELERTRTLLAVIGEAIAQLSLAHTLSTAAERIAELFG